MSFTLDNLGPGDSLDLDGPPDTRLAERLGLSWRHRYVCVRVGDFGSVRCLPRRSVIATAIAAEPLAYLISSCFAADSPEVGVATLNGDCLISHARRLLSGDVVGQFCRSRSELLRDADDGKPVGAIVTTLLPTTLWIAWLMVRQDARAEGLGTYLLDKVLRSAQDRTVSLSVTASSPALGFYFAAGFRVAREGTLYWR